MSGSIFITHASVNTTENEISYDTFNAKIFSADEKHVLFYNIS